MVVAGKSTPRPEFDGDDDCPLPSMAGMIIKYLSGLRASCSVLMSHSLSRMAPEYLGAEWGVSESFGRRERGDSDAPRRIEDGWIRGIPERPVGEEGGGNRRSGLGVAREDQLGGLLGDGWSSPGSQSRRARSVQCQLRVPCLRCDVGERERVNWGNRGRMTMEPRVEGLAGDSGAKREDGQGMNGAGER
jgi:hypothetical protein